MTHTADWIGWVAAAVLLATIGRQVYTQWRDRSSRGVSHWLFIGQFTSSIGFIIYSWMLGSWVFLATNTMMLVVAAIGQGISMRNRQPGRTSTATGKSANSSAARSRGRSR
jgi:MtN3 and saliva related transmembrane protein